MKDWTEVAPPKRKTDYVGRFVKLFRNPPMQPMVFSARKKVAPEIDSILRICRRLNAQDTMSCARDVSSWGSIRIMDVEFECPHCGTPYRIYFPESWATDGDGAVFVEIFAPNEAKE